MKFKQNLKLIPRLLIVLVSLSSQWSLAGIPLSKSLDPAKIYGYQPYMNSIGTIMYNVNTVGNPSAMDENGKRVPTEGSIIGFKDLFCVEGGLNDSTPLLVSEWQPFFDYADSDLDICNKDAPHTVEWYMIDTPDISVINSWSEIADKATLITSTNYSDAIISPKSSYTFHEGTGIGSDETVSSPISGDVTSALRVPSEAIGKYIGVRYIPLSQTGLPLQGLAVEMWDLNYFYGQTPPTTPGEAPQDGADALKTIKKGENNYVGGTGGGKVQPAPERPDIDELIISGVMSPGRTLTLDYQFIPYPQTNPDSRATAGDKSVFVWGASDTNFYASNYDVFKSLKENDIHQADEIRMTQGREVVLELADIGTFVEVSALPIRQEATELFPVPGIAKTYRLADFSENIEPLQRPVVSNLMIQGMPMVGSKLTASYLYTPSNSMKSYDASTYIWTYDTVSVKDGKTTVTSTDNMINEGTVETNVEALPDYTNNVTISTLDTITDTQLGGPAITPLFVGNIIRVKVQAKDATGLMGNTAEDHSAPKLGVPNDMFGIKLVAYNYGGSFPVNRLYGTGYPSTGFAGAQFQLFAESFDAKTNESNWNWDVVENEFYASVDKTGIVTLLRIPPKDSVIRVIAKNKTNPSLVRSHSFTINKWLVSFNELSNGSKGYSFGDAGKLCQNYKRSVTEVFLPSVDDLTSLPVDPNNPLQSLGAKTRAPGWNTIYTFPSEDFFSQWGELDYYFAIDSKTGLQKGKLAFEEAGTAYTWTRSLDNNRPIFAAPTGWADWFVTDNEMLLLNAACIAYSDNFNPELPPMTEEHMRGIKLPYTGYPRNNTGFETFHEYGKGFPSLGFHGAKFILFAQDGPGSSKFITNNTSDNSYWQWQINDGSIATKSAPSRNDYAFVTQLGEVVLLSPPPIGTVISITATNGSIKLRHSFSIDKWLYSYADLNVNQLQTKLGAADVCIANSMRLPTVEEYTAMPVDPKNPEQSLGFGKREEGGWSIIYDFPSKDFYSQWGELDYFYRYNKDLKQMEGTWNHNDYWSASVTKSGNTILTRNSGWGDWLAFNGKLEMDKLYFSCISEFESVPPQIDNLKILGTLNINSELTGSYDFLEGKSADSADASEYIWYKDEVALNQWTSVTSTEFVPGITLNADDIGKTISLEVKPKDKAGVSGAPVKVAVKPPTITDLKFVDKDGANAIFIQNRVIYGAYDFNRGSSDTDELFNSSKGSKAAWNKPLGTTTGWSNNPSKGKTVGYTIKESDVNNVVTLQVYPVDLANNRGATVVASTPENLRISISELKISPALVNTKLQGTYSFYSFSTLYTDLSSYTWFTLDDSGNEVVIKTDKVPGSGKVGETPVLNEDYAGKVIHLRVVAKSQYNTVGNTLETSVTMEKLENITFSTNLVEITQYFPASVRAYANYSNGTQIDITETGEWSIDNNLFKLDKGSVEVGTASMLQEATITVTYRGVSGQVPVKYVEVKTTGVLGSDSGNVNSVLIRADQHPKIQVWTGDIVDGFRSSAGKMLSGGGGGTFEKYMNLNKITRIEVVTSTYWSYSNGKEYMTKLIWNESDVLNTDGTQKPIIAPAARNITPTGGGVADITRKIYAIIAYNNTADQWASKYLTGIEIIYY